MRFVADECLDGRIIKRLITDGHELVVIRSELTGLRDADVLRITNERDAVLITEDKDFGDLVFRIRALHTGVVLVRLPGLPGAIQAEIVSKAVQMHGEALYGSFTVITEKRLRIRKG
jgi:predicted nuclease of predicted toxin-antitoxin system